MKTCVQLKYSLSLDNNPCIKPLGYFYFISWLEYLVKDIVAVRGLIKSILYLKIVNTEELSAFVVVSARILNFPGKQTTCISLIWYFAILTNGLENK